MDISPSLFDLEESASLVQERVNEQASEILKRFEEMLKADVEVPATNEAPATDALIQLEE